MFNHLCLCFYLQPESLNLSQLASTVADLNATIQPVPNSIISYDVAKTSAQRLGDEILSLRNIFEDLSQEAESFDLTTLEVYLTRYSN